MSIQLTDEQKLKLVKYLKKNNSTAEDVDVNIFDECVKDITDRVDIDTQRCSDYIWNGTLSYILGGIDEEDKMLIKEFDENSDMEMLISYLFSKPINFRNLITGLVITYISMCINVQIQPSDSIMGLVSLTEYTY